MVKRDEVASEPNVRLPACRRLLIVDDESYPRRALARYMRSRGYHVAEADSGEACLKGMSENAPAVVILDLVMPGMGGLETLRAMRRSGNDVPVVILTAIHDIDAAMEATRLGATEYITKPYQPQLVVDAVDRCVAERVRRRSVLGETSNDAATGYGELVGCSATMHALFARLRTLEGIAPPSVLVMGESGTGKDVVARTIHARGPRARAPFVEVDCTSIPESLMESTLFGHEKGAFTGAARQHAGLFEIAAGGVVFLDEIGEMAPASQAKLLRTLENRRFKRVGGTTDIHFDACVIAATNRDLMAEVAAGRFREDLYYRLAIIPIDAPPLRERVEDIPLLVRHFCRKFGDQFNRNADIDGDAMVALCDYRWPGNVRELRNVLERLVIFNTGASIGLADLPPEIRFSQNPAAESEHRFVLPEEGIDLEQVERSFIEQALQRTAGNQVQAARLVGLTRFGLRSRMKKFTMLKVDE